MKTIYSILVILSLFAFSTAHSQTQKGSLLLGGSASMNFTIEPSSSFQLRINPDLGIFVIDRLAIGGRLATGFTLGNSFQQYNFGIIPNVKYYFGISDSLDVFIEGGFGPSVFVTTVNAPFGDETNTNTLFSIFTGPSLVFFINPNTGIHVGLTYSGAIGDDFADQHSTSINAGFQIYLPKGSK